MITSNRKHYIRPFLHESNSRIISFGPCTREPSATLIGLIQKLPSLKPESPDASRFLLCTASQVWRVLDSTSSIDIVVPLGLCQPSFFMTILLMPLDTVRLHWHDGAASSFKRPSSAAPACGSSPAIAG